MQITFLGTTAMVPTKDRNHFAFFLSYKDEGILFDCGEGTQRQLRIAGIKPSKITKIIISHFHGDHILGIPGLLQTLSASEYEGTLKIYGPKGLKRLVEEMMRLFVYDNKLSYELIEIEKTRFIDTKDYYIEAYELDHNIFCYGYRMVEKDRFRINMTKAHKFGLKEGPELGRLQSGMEITYKGKLIKPEDVTYVVKGNVLGFIADTIMTPNCLKIAQDADLLISEATHASKDEDKSSKYKHFTGKQAAYVASKANVKKLILTHFSQRYSDINEVVQDAVDVFPETIAAFDFMKTKV
jgi:ribonuclease Z